MKPRIAPAVFAFAALCSAAALFPGAAPAQSGQKANPPILPQAGYPFMYQQAPRQALPDIETLQDEEAITPKNSQRYQQEQEQMRALEREQDSIRRHDDAEFERLQKSSETAP